MPIVSILTTVYNREKYIAECIESVLASTYHDWEMIIVDDCSSDNSVAIAREYEKKDARIKVFVNETNLGDYPNRNKAASLATGKYIKYLDADDLIYPHGLEIMVTTMEKFPEAALGISQEVYEDYLPYPFLMLPHETFNREFLMRGVLGAPPTNTIIRRDIFENNGCFSGIRYSGDTEMWLKLAFKYPIVKMVPGLTYWRRHEGQEYALGLKSNSYLIQNYKLKVESLQNPSCPLSQDERQKALKKIKYRHARNIINLSIIQRKPLNALKTIKETNFSFIDVLKGLRKLK